MWQPLGLVDCRIGALPWRASHAFVPTPYQISEEIIRIYVAFLDESKVGRIGYVDVSARDPRQVVGVSRQPVLDIGAPGCFDDHGVTPMTVVKVGGELRLYYTGWQLSSTIRYYLLAGLAVSRDGGESFSRASQAPLLERSERELTVRTATHVALHAGTWKMWYIAGSSTIVVDGKQVPTYDMRYLESADGLKWGDHGRVVMAPAGEDEYGFGRPYVLGTSTGFEMWYSIRTRSRGYHLGYATSADGLHWLRRDDMAGAAPPRADWDSRMQAFGAVVDSAYGRFIFYNGDEYGQAGFGVARWQ
jgi:predicted GH43/DUF377 family glycosyl hydrolase